MKLENLYRIRLELNGAKIGPAKMEEKEMENPCQTGYIAYGTKEKDGVTVLAIEQVESAIFLQDFKVEKDKKYALVFGNEVFGVSQEAVAICDGCIEIPQLGTKHSLNISVSTGIVVWDLFKKMKWQK
jgi:tRNA G18 (ribose-2'-O)-methylase SpoU